MAWSIAGNFVPWLLSCFLNAFKAKYWITSQLTKCLNNVLLTNTESTTLTFYGPKACVGYLYPASLPSTKFKKCFFLQQTAAPSENLWEKYNYCAVNKGIAEQQWWKWVSVNSWYCAIIHKEQQNKAGNGKITVSQGLDSYTLTPWKEGSLSGDNKSLTV